MSNITLEETSNFSEQLGIYDFFNVIISGAVFVFGLCAINSNLWNLIFKDTTIPKGLGIVLLMYITGLVLQEIGSLADKKKFQIYEGMSRSILKSTFDEEEKEILVNDILDNELLIKKYRGYADLVLGDLVDKSNPKRFNDSNVNGFFFSVCQYYVAVNGKDKKVEKMRALFSMSKILMVCFALVSLINIVIFLPCDILRNKVLGVYCINRIITSVIFVVIAIIFYRRTKKTMRRFLLILLGTYDAIIRSEKSEKTENRETNEEH